MLLRVRATALVWVRAALRSRVVFDIAFDGVAAFESFVVRRPANTLRAADPGILFEVLVTRAVCLRMFGRCHRPSSCAAILSEARLAWVSLV
ncbi:hypothetical protein EMEDMD4_240060 [Sinorhizobium medicae]|uniref:Uncharacterized protein n=1 Tax=Sinorhizobium medicae TaxID=110321 RepID=A0A508WU82_9HYPH|nr:hypothetical protein EMEDMD4_240060 [Sinorhizobium medicae]